MLYKYIYMDDYVAPPIILLENGMDLQKEFDLVLNELVLSFPTGKVTPDLSSNYVPNKTYGEEYLTAQQRMIQLQEDYFMYRNKILKNNKMVVKKIEDLDSQINALDDENKVLKDKAISLRSSSYSAKGMLDDSKLSRNQLMVGNVFLFVIVTGVGYIYYKKTTGNA